MAASLAACAAPPRVEEAEGRAADTAAHANIEAVSLAACAAPPSVEEAKGRAAAAATGRHCGARAEAEAARLAAYSPSIEEVRGRVAAAAAAHAEAEARGYGAARGGDARWAGGQESPEGEVAPAEAEAARVGPAERRAALGSLRVPEAPWGEGA